MLKITENISIDDSELVERFVRASGPGGQNVNKLSTAVELRFDVAGSSLPDEVKERLLRRKDRRLNADGVMIIQAQRFRTQERNREDARDRLQRWIEQSVRAPKRRVATKPSKGSVERRLGSKRERAEIKRQRSVRTWGRD